MQIHDGELPRARQLPRTGKELGREARVRLDWMDFYRRDGNGGPHLPPFRHQPPDPLPLAAPLGPHNLSTLEARSHRPYRRRQPTWSSPLADRVLALRQRYPRWGKDKLAVLLHQQQIPVSTSMVGRILGQL